MPDLVSAIAVVRLGVVVLAAALLGLAALNDIATRTIPDAAPLALFVLGVATRLIEGNAGASLAASAAVLLIGAVCWRCRWLGGGDVKLLAASAWLVPPALVPQLVMLTAIAGGVLAGVYLMLGRLPWIRAAATRAAPARSLSQRIWRAERWRIRRRAGLPYGCAIAAATLLTLWVR